jgi:hypothetical protein
MGSSTNLTVQYATDQNLRANFLVFPSTTDDCELRGSYGFIDEIKL